ncbi:MAG: hypothetical protein IT497_02830 [Ottowia sp.]|nr:hypothetical protein [Ottowia sp.]
MLNGSGAIYALNTAANNNVNTLAATGAASINFKNNRSLTVGTVGTVSGVSAAGNITIAAVDAQGVSSGSAVDLTLNNAVRSTSGNIALTAGRAFYNNNATDTGIVVASGSRYTVYSYSPMNLAGGGSARGMTLNASTQKHYNVSNPASANYASGNWFLYAMQPTLTAGINGATITYGDLFTPSFTGYTGFIDGDTSSTVTGAPGLIVSGGRSTSGNYTAGQHNMTVDLTNVATNLGYAFTSGGAQLTVNKKEIVITGGTVTATSRPYSGTANNIVAVNDTGFHLSGVMTNDVIASSVSTGIGRMQDGNAGVNKHVVVDLNSLIKGADAGNYFANTVAVSTTVTISPVQLIANASSVTKVFDGTLNVPGKGQVQLNLQPGDQLIGSLFSESYANAMPQGKGGSVVLVINPSAAWSISNAYGDALQNYLLPVVLNSASGTILPIPSIPANGNNPFISLGGGDDNDNNNGDVNNPRNSEGKMMVGMTCTIFDKTHGIWQGCGVVKNRRLAHARSGSNPALIF